MITKTGKQFEKRANLLLAPIVHILQNLMLKRYMRDPRMAKLMWQRFSLGAHDGKHMTRDASLFNHIQGNLIPEIKLLAAEAQHMGERYAKPVIAPLKADAALGNNFQSRRNLVRMRRLAKGEFSKFIGRPLSSEEKDLMSRILLRGSKELDSAKLQNLLDNITPEKAKALEELYKTNPVTSLLRNATLESQRSGVVGENTAKSISTSAARKWIGIPATVAVNGALAIADPITATVNVGKQVAFSPTVGEKVPGLGAAQKAIKNTFVTKPTINAFKNPKVNTTLRFLDENVVNPLNSNVKDLARDLRKFHES